MFANGLVITTVKNRVYFVSFQHTCTYSSELLSFSIKHNSLDFFMQFLTKAQNFLGKFRQMIFNMSLEIQISTFHRMESFSRMLWKPLYLCTALS